MFRITVLGSLGLYSFDWGNFYAERNFFFRTYLHLWSLPLLYHPRSLLFVHLFKLQRTLTKESRYVCSTHSISLTSMHNESCAGLWWNMKMTGMIEANVWGALSRVCS